MNEKTFAGWDNKVVVRAGYVPSGNGCRVTVDLWDGSNYRDVYSALVFADSFYECVSGALGSTGFDEDQVQSLMDDFGIEFPFDEEEDNK